MKCGMACRCGWEGRGPHPCHGWFYNCDNPGTPRYVTRSVGIAGARLKVGAYRTFACDECWGAFLRSQLGTNKPGGSSCRS